MPRIARFKVVAIAELFRQLEYAPPETRRRQMDATERLIGDIDARQNYPEDFIIFRITGYRPDRAEEPVTLVGEALLPDLLNLVLLLSRGLQLPVEKTNRRSVPLAEVAQRLDVSAKTIQRYRRQGLVCHHVVYPDGIVRLACFEDALQRFMQGHLRQIEKAADYTRINGEREAAIVERARTLRNTERLSLNQTAQRLAAEHDRAHETIRQLLRRHDRQAAEPIFRDAAPLSDRGVRLMHRAWRFGIEPEVIARHYGKSKPTVHRAVNRRRAELLSELDLSFVRLPMFDHAEAEDVILSAPVATTGLDESFADDLDAIAFIESSRSRTPGVDLTDDAMIAAYNILKMRSGEQLTSLGAAPASADLDEIETSLRWAAMLKRRLVMHALPTALRRIEQNLHRPLSQQPREYIAQLLGTAVEVASASVEQVDPGRDQQLDRIVAFSMDRALARQPIHESVNRAAARHPARTLRLEEFLKTIVPWDWLSLPSRWRHRLSSLDNASGLKESARLAMVRRHGWDGETPQTLAALVRELRMNPTVLVRLLRKAEVHLRRAADGR